MKVLVTRIRSCVTADNFRQNGQCLDGANFPERLAGCYLDIIADFTREPGSFFQQSSKRSNQTVICNITNLRDHQSKKFFRRRVQCLQQKILLGTLPDIGGSLQHLLLHPNILMIQKGCYLGKRIRICKHTE